MKMTLSGKSLVLKMASLLNTLENLILKKPILVAT